MPAAAGDVRIFDVLLTHGHDDHTGSAAAPADRTGARVLGPTADAPVIEGERAPPPPDLGDREVPLHQLDRERPARIIAAPGDTAGSVAVLFEDDGVLVAGDAIASFEGEPIVGVFNVDRAQAAATFLRLAALDVDIACFGHGQPLVGGAGARLARVAATL